MQVPTRMKIHNALSVDLISAKYTSSFKQADTLSLPERRDLINLLNTSYSHWGIDQVFEHYPCTKQLYVFRLWTDNQLIASRQILLVDSYEAAPEWSVEMAHALSIHHFAIGSRAIVHPNYRNQGLGHMLVRKINQTVFSTQNISAILGSSTSIGALSL